MQLSSNGKYSENLTLSIKKSEINERYEVKKSNGNWYYDMSNNKIILQKILDESSIKLVPKKYQEKINGITYLVPITYRIELINDKKMILHDEFHNSYIHYEK